jgi:hypothetical protein
MEVEEFEERTKSIVEVELKKITTMVKKYQTRMPRSKQLY